MPVRMVALKAHRYAQRSLAVGEEFEVRDKDVKLWKGLKRARVADPPTVEPNVEKVMVAEPPAPVRTPRARRVTPEAPIIAPEVPMETASSETLTGGAEVASNTFTPGNEPVTKTE